MRRGAPLVAAAAGGVALTVLVTFNPLVHFAYDNLSLHVALETSEGLIGALLAYLALQRFRARALTRDLLLGWTFSVLAATNLLLSAVPLVTLGERPVGTLTWAVAGLRLSGAAGLCAAAFVPVGVASRGPRPVRLLAAGTAVVLVAVALWSLGAGAWLADAVDPSLSPESSGRTRVVGHPVVLGIQVVAMVLYAGAAAGFRRQAGRVDDALLPWLAAGAVLAAFARLNFFLFPSLYSTWVYTGDLLRLGSYLLFLVGAARQIDLYRRDQTRVAVFEERRRMARELHDGLVQELSFIRSQTAGMAGGMHLPEMAGFVSAAADRALQESRRIIEALTETDDEPLAEALRAAAEEVATRVGTKVDLQATASPVVSGDVRTSLVRVVREAVSNAVRHGEAEKVSLRLRTEGRTLRLTIADDGRGFETGQVETGFGLRSMRERVLAMGGTFALESRPAGGTLVEVAVPIAPQGWLIRRGADEPGPPGPGS